MLRIYVDEAATMYPQVAEGLLTGGRKFGAALVLLCQSLHLYEGSLSDLALGAGTQVAFAQSPAGAARLSQLFDTSQMELVNQPDQRAHVRIGHRATCTVDTSRYNDPCPVRRCSDSADVVKL